MVIAPLCWHVSLCKYCKFNQGISFTLTFERAKASFRLATAWHTKQAGDLSGDSVQFIAFDFALHLRAHNGNFHRPSTHRARRVFSLPRWWDQLVAKRREKSKALTQRVSQLTDRTNPQLRKTTRGRCRVTTLLTTDIPNLIFKHISTIYQIYLWRKLKV